MVRIAWALVLATAGLAQVRTDGPSTGQVPVNNAAVSGVVKEAGTGQPLAGYVVETTAYVRQADGALSRKDVFDTTDDRGYYRLGDLPPGYYRILSRAKTEYAEALGANRSRRVRLAGSDLENIDFTIARLGTISGRVLDENREPVSGVRVYLVQRQYFKGALRYLFKFALSDDRGHYVLDKAEAGRPYLLMVDGNEDFLPGQSDAPLSPKLRRPVALRTWYPNSPQPEEAMPVVLRSGERREGVDIVVGKAPSYCLEGALVAPTGPGESRFYIEQLLSNDLPGAARVGLLPGGVTGADGRFRICKLTPGTYRLSAWKLEQQNRQNQQFLFAPDDPQLYGVAMVTIADRDIRDYRLALTAAQSLEGEVVWDGPAPAGSASRKLTIALTPTRAGFQGKSQHPLATADIPGSFSLSDVVGESYYVQPSLSGAGVLGGLYVKDVTYSGKSVLHESLDVGHATPGAGLRIVVANDGGKIGVRVTDKNGNPVSGAQIVIIPGDIPSAAIMADAMAFGQTYENGTYTAGPLPPGKYWVMASSETFEPTPESMARLLSFRNRFTEVLLSANGTAQVTLQPIALE
jgi:hypothetical protein